MLELFNVQIHMARHRAENYGTVTAVLMHLIRCVNHSPIALSSYLRETLKELRYEEKRERFRMFFLHDLDLENGTIQGIDEEDSPQCKFDMSKTALAKKPRPTRHILANTDPSSQFPIGNAPTWPDIVHLLRHEPSKLMRTWVWDPDWSVDEDAATLFKAFTRQYWLTIQKDRFITSQPKPDTLEEAMEVWTIPSLVSLLSEITCLASNHGLDGRFHGTGHRAFRDWMNVFFPSPEKPQHRDSVWRELFSDGAYISEYHGALETMSNADVTRLQLQLGDIFGRLQCVPNALESTATSVGRLWKGSDGMVEFCANPLHYRIEKVSPTVRTPTDALRLKATREAILDGLAAELEGVDIDSSRRARRRDRNAQKKKNARKSGNKRNARKPPQKRGPRTRATGNEEEVPPVPVPAIAEKQTDASEISVSSENAAAESSEDNNGDNSPQRERMVSGWTVFADDSTEYGSDNQDGQSCDGDDDGEEWDEMGYEVSGDEQSEEY
jgi:hypothetical protein